MKKHILAITIFTTISLTGCGHEHTFSEATCTDPKICTECQETEGTALDHNWIDATCENPKTCSLCNITEGNPLDHNWIDATMESPKTCSLCNLTEGEPLATDSGVDSADTSVTLEPDEYKGDNNYETNTPEEQAQIDAELVEMFKEDLENGDITEEDYNLIIEGMFLEPVQESTPSVNVTKIGPGATVTDGHDNGIEYGEVQVGSGDYSGLEHYRID